MEIQGEGLHYGMGANGGSMVGTDAAPFCCNDHALWMNLARRRISLIPNETEKDLDSCILNECTQSHRQRHDDSNHKQCTGAFTMNPRAVRFLVSNLTRYCLNKPLIKTRSVGKVQGVPTNARFHTKTTATTSAYTVGIPTMSSPTQSPKLHPLLKQLGLSQNNYREGDCKNNKSNATSVSALHLLNHLLQSQKVTTDAVQEAHQAVQRQQERDQAVDRAKSKARAMKLASQSYRTRHVALQVFYDGEAYTGLAENVGQPGDHSIERALFQAMAQCQLIPTADRAQLSANDTTDNSVVADNKNNNNTASLHYSRCGRTDKGVSSAGQVVALHLKSAISAEATWDAKGQHPVTNDQLPKYHYPNTKNLEDDAAQARTVWVPPRRDGRKANKNPENADDKDQATALATRQSKVMREYAYDHILNNLLPPDIRVLGWTPVSEDFSARFSAGARTYRYFFCARSLKIERMRQALAYFVGTHDFRNFCKLNVEQVSNFTRTIHRADIVRVNGGNGGSSQDVYFFEIMGQAFLWHQIRCMVSDLFLVGRGLEDPTVVRELLDVEKHPGKPSYPLADEKPLVLHDCAFTSLKFGTSARNSWNLACHQEGIWESLILKAARIRNSLDKMGESVVRVADIEAFVRDRSAVQRKKTRKYGNKAGTTENKNTVDETEPVAPFSTELITWNEALAWMATLNMIPEPDGSHEMFHMPLLQRSKGTSYEEKVASLKNKRKSRFEENLAKKRHSEETDQAFYHRMSKQGGSAFD